MTTSSAFSSISGFTFTIGPFFSGITVSFSIRSIFMLGQLSSTGVIKLMRELLGRDA
jgi:hypothetical protein